MELDDIRPESWSRLMSATSDYCSQPQVAAQFDRLAVLLKQGTPATAAEAAAAAGQQVHASSVRKMVKGLAPNAGWSTQLDSTGPQGQLQTQQQRQHQQQQQHYQQLQLQHQTGQLLLGRSLLNNLAGSSTSQQHIQQQQAGGMSDLEPAVAAALQKAAADGTPAAAPRLLYQRDVLLVQAPRQVAGAAAAAATAQGVNLSALQQQEHVAQLLAAALPPNLLHVCDLQDAAASAAFVSLPKHGNHTGHTSGAAKQQQQQQHAQQHPQQQHIAHQQPRHHALQLADLSTSAKVSQGGAPHSADPSPCHLAATRHASIGSSHQHSSSTAAALAAAAGRSGQLQRQSDTGLTSLASPKPASWLEYIFPWQGSSSANSSPRHAQLAGADGKQAGGTTVAEGDSAATAAGAAGVAGTAATGRSVQLPSGAWASSGAGIDSILGSPAKELAHFPQSRSGVEARHTGKEPCAEM